MTKASPKFRRLLLNAILVPLLLMVGVAVVLVVQVTRLMGASRQVQHSDVVIADANALEKLTIDLETGLRGYLVTGSDLFLEPYRRGLSVIDAESADLLKQVADDDPEQAARVRDLAARRATWKAYALQMIALRQSGTTDFRSIVVNGEGKRQMDSMRAVFASLLSAETSVERHRLELAQAASRLTLVLVGVVALGGGGLLAVLARYQFLELTRTFDAAIKTAVDLNAQLERRVAERTAELEQRSVQLAEANKELEAFAYSISHDLRAPMRHITGFADLLRRSIGPTLSTDDSENLTTIFDTAKLAGRMVDDLLSFSRVGRASLREASVDLNVLVADARRELEPDTKGRDVQWDLGALPTVRADPAMLKMVVANLLANAIKYTGTRPAAHITVGTCDATPPAATVDERSKAVAPAVGPTVTCFVRDNGVGFSMDYAGKLFGVFQRLHRAEEFDGTGIGLANVRRILTRMGGHVWAEGTVDAGATFYFDLPVASDGPARQV